MVRGFVMKPAVEKRASEVQDGILRYADENGVECFAAYGAHQVRNLLFLTGHMVKFADGHSACLVPR